MTPPPSSEPMDTLEAQVVPTSSTICYASSTSTSPTPSSPDIPTTATTKPPPPPQSRTNSITSTHSNNPSASASPSSGFMATMRTAASKTTDLLGLPSFSSQQQRQDTENNEYNTTNNIQRNENSTTDHNDDNIVVGNNNSSRDGFCNGNGVINNSNDVRGDGNESNGFQQGEKETIEGGDRENIQAGIEGAGGGGAVPEITMVAPHSAPKESDMVVEVVQPTEENATSALEPTTSSPLSSFAHSSSPPVPTTTATATTTSSSSLVTPPIPSIELIPTTPTSTTPPSAVTTLFSKASNNNHNNDKTNPPSSSSVVDTEYRPQAQPPSMDFAQPDLMTMEAFQSNGGGVLRRDDSSQDFSSNQMYISPGQPGSFPESPLEQQQRQQRQDYNGVGPLDRDGSSTLSNDNDDSYGANISFVYANEKRFSDFHALFRSVPDDEKLIEDYGCALQKEILVQGRLYISENHVCFNANIFGWVTNLVIAFSEITAIEKRLTAFVIPNAISITTTTNTRGHFFASFLSRDAAHDLLMAAWRKSFPCAANASAINNNIYFRQNRSNLTLNEDDDDAQSFISARAPSDSRRNRHRRSSSASQNWTADEADWDEFEEMEGRSTTNGTTNGSHGSRRRSSKKAATVKKILKDVVAPIIPGEDGLNGISSEGKRRARSASELPPRLSSFGYEDAREFVGSKSSAELPATQAHSNGHATNGPTGSKSNSKATPNNNSSRSPTTCKCSKDGRHYANMFMTETFPGSIESMWKLLFESDFSKNFLTNEAMKGADVQEEPWQKTPDGNSSKITKYTKWIGLAIGPKTTKAILTDVCEHKDFEDYVTTVTTTSTPDVPSGGSFTTKCRTCITWAGPNQVQVVVTGAIEFTKSSWIKGQIEKGAAEGMGTHYRELNLSIRKHIASFPDKFQGSGGTASVGAPGVGLAGTKVNGAASPSSSSNGSPTQNGGHKMASRDRLQSGRSGQQQPSAVAIESQGNKGSSQIPSSSSKEGASTTAEGLWDQLGNLVSWNDADGLSHMALVSVLVVVMLANIYIWFQISSVTSQIEKIQNEVLQGGQRMMPRHYGGYVREPFSSASSRQDRGQDSHGQEQEEAMWAWLTAREERHRQLQRMNNYDWSSIRRKDEERRARRGPNDRQQPQSDDENSSSSPSSDSGNSNNPYDTRAYLEKHSLTEAQLQARIDDLQRQLENLERALDQSYSTEA